MRIALLFLMTLALSQDANKKANQFDFSLTLKAVKIGIDVESQFRAEVDGGDESIGLGGNASMHLDNGLSFGVEAHINDMFDAGIEIFPGTDANASIFGTWGSVSHWSLYGLYNLYSDDNIDIKPKLGFSTFNIDPSNQIDDGNIDSSGGLMLGFQVEYRDIMHISYTWHYGSWSSKSSSNNYEEEDWDDYDDDYNNGTTSSYSTRTSRLTVSYAFNQFDMFK